MDSTSAFKPIADNQLDIQPETSLIKAISKEGYQLNTHGGIEISPYYEERIREYVETLFFPEVRKALAKLPPFEEGSPTLFFWRTEINKLLQNLPGIEAVIDTSMDDYQYERVTTLGGYGRMYKKPSELKVVADHAIRCIDAHLYDLSLPEPPLLSLFRCFENHKKSIDIEALEMMYYVFNRYSTNPDTSPDNCYRKLNDILPGGAGFAIAYLNPLAMGRYEMDTNLTNFSIYLGELAKKYENYVKDGYVVQFIPTGVPRLGHELPISRKASSAAIMQNREKILRIIEEQFQIENH